MEWKEAVRDAITRLCRRKARRDFTRQELIREELPRILAATGCKGATPQQTLSRVLQELRDEGEIKFLGRGRYRVLRGYV